MTSCSTIIIYSCKLLIASAERDRIGGRIWTDYGKGFPAELGASWLHGIDYGNPIPFLAQTYDHLQDAPAPAAKGFDQILRKWAADLDIRQNQIVHQIHHNDEGVRIATYSDVFQARYGTVTLPLGVLKSGSIAFSPQLPDRKQQAISQLGTGLLNRLYLQFPYAATHPENCASVHGAFLSGLREAQKIISLA